MLYVERDEKGAIVAIRQGGEQDAGRVPVSLLDAEVTGLLRSSGEHEPLARLLLDSDTSIIRVLEDLIDLLIAKKIMNRRPFHSISDVTWLNSRAIEIEHFQCRVASMFLYRWRFQSESRFYRGRLTPIWQPKAASDCDLSKPIPAAVKAEFLIKFLRDEFIVLLVCIYLQT